MAEDNIDKYMDKERARVTKEREGLVEQQKQLAEQIAALDRKVAAFDAYEAALKSKPKRAGATGTRGPRANSMRQVLLNTLTNSSGGLTRSELFEKMGIKTNDPKAQTISTSLSNLKKAGKLKQEGNKWMAVV